MQQQNPSTNRNNQKTIYRKQDKTRKAIENEIQTRTKNTLEKLIEAGGVNSNNFWQIRKKLIGKGEKKNMTR